MNATLIELTASIVASHATAHELTSDELVDEINKVFSALKKLESGEAKTDAAAPQMTLRKAFQNDQVCCMLCGKTGFKTLTRHLRQAHDMKPGQYRKQFNIPSDQSLTAKNYSEARRKAANENNLAANLEKARAKKAEKKQGKTAVKTTAKPAKAPKTAKAAVKPGPARPKAKQAKQKA